VKNRLQALSLEDYVPYSNNALVYSLKGVVFASIDDLLMSSCAVDFNPYYYFDAVFWRRTGYEGLRTRERKISGGSERPG
jgi:hypothetical protein